MRLGVFGRHLDILTHSGRTDQYLDMFLRLLREHKLFAITTKCDFFKPELKYLGHLVCVTCIKPDSAKIQTVSDWPQPCSIAEVHPLLGLENYFCKFIREYAATSAPLTDLSKGLSAHEHTNTRKLQSFPKQTLDKLAVSLS